jgi:predicted translin family RNA/ssDNA-binding protein
MNSPNQPADPSQNKAAEHIADAHQLLESLKRKLGQHPELDEAIAKLELALSALTLQTGGLL